MNQPSLAAAILRDLVNGPTSLCLRVREPGTREVLQGLFSARLIRRDRAGRTVIAWRGRRYLRRLKAAALERAENREALEPSSLTPEDQALLLEKHASPGPIFLVLLALAAVFAWAAFRVYLWATAGTRGAP